MDCGCKAVVRLIAVHGSTFRWSAVSFIMTKNYRRVNGWPDAVYPEWMALKLNLLMPRVLILASRVCRGRPSRTAAPLGPDIRPRVSFSAASIISFWAATSEDHGGISIPARWGDSGVCQDFSTTKVSPSHRITALSITFCSSRMCPASHTS